MCDNCSVIFGIPEIDFGIFTCVLIVMFCAMKQMRQCVGRRWDRDTASHRQRDAPEQQQNENVEVIMDSAMHPTVLASDLDTILAEIRLASERRAAASEKAKDERKEFISNLLVTKTIRGAHGSALHSEAQNDDIFIFGGKGGEEDRTCPICLVEYEDEEQVCFSHNRRCHHSFHKHCAVEWLSEHDECPCCRQNFLALSDDEESVETPAPTRNVNVNQIFQMHDAIQLITNMIANQRSGQDQLQQNEIIEGSSSSTDGDDQTPSQFREMNRSVDEEATLSLDLGDLAAESILQRAVVQDGSTRTLNSESVYTEGSPLSPATMGGEYACAICGSGSQERSGLCWSQDPLCNHLFHRMCLEACIENGDACPRCANDVDASDGTFSYVESSHSASVSSSDVDMMSDLECG